MKQNMKTIIPILAVTILVSTWMLINSGESRHDDGERNHGHTDEHEEEISRGPHGGRLLLDHDFGVEITIHETGVPPEFHVYAYMDGKPIEPSNIDLGIQLLRLGDITDTISFKAEQDYLKGDTVIYEPHSFEVIVEASYDNKSYRWQYENFEGRTRIAHDMAQTMGITTDKVGPIQLHKIRSLTGLVHTDPNRLSRVRPRFAGVVKSIRHELGDFVKKGNVLASVQSNESLQTYKVTAPINGLIINRDVQVGESTGPEPLFIIADLSSVWIELDVFSRDLDDIKRGQSVVIESLDGQHKASATIDWISPLAAHASQSVRARVQLPNENGAFRPGQFIRGHVTIANKPVALAVRKSAIQRFRDFQVAYARFGDTYEVRMLELGEQNSEWIEVLSGIDAGTEYVITNSYLIKADIEKSGASHDH